MTENDYKKDWGLEISWCNEKDYGGKVLIFDKPGAKTDFYFHKEISKSWFVNSGKFMIRWIDTKDGKVYQAELSEGSVHKVDTLLPVSLECISSGTISEVSNGSDKDDIYIVIPAANIGV